MKYRYRTDEEMKDSGVEWFGNIPRLWKVSKIKYLASITNGQVDPTQAPYCNMPHIGPENIEKYSGRLLGYKLAKEENLTSGKYYFQKNEILYGKINPQLGKSIMAEFEGICSADMYPLKSNLQKVIPGYLRYYILSKVFFNQSISFPARAGIPKINREELESIFVVLPKKSEQEIITNFLNEKTSQFDSIISKKEVLIEKLEEAKKSLISEVVTGKVKIVKTEEEYNVVPRSREEMKDSGVEWLEFVPKEWKIVKLKHLVSQKITDGPHETPKLVDSGVPFLSAEAIVNSSISIPNMRGYITEEQYNIYSKKSKVEFGDILFCKSGSTTGKAALVSLNEKFGIWSPLAIIRAKEEVINRINLFYLILSPYFRVQVENYWTFGTQPNIGMGTLENLYIPISSNINEQKNITLYLENRIEEINNIIKNINYEINKLKEAKQSLITEAVTGKIEILD